MLNRKQLGRAVYQIMIRLDSYKRLLKASEMECAMCSAYGYPYTLNFAKIYDDCAREAAEIVSRHTKVPVEDCIDAWDEWSRV